MTERPTTLFVLTISRVARKFLDTLPDKHYRQIDVRLEALRGDPRPHDSIPFKGQDKQRRVTVGEYRVLYDTDDGVRIVAVVYIGARKEKRIYKRR
jgi:mRNA interferase RelE/StbE